MTAVLIIGYGNPLRGDDNAGRTVAARLAAELPPDAATIVEAHQLLPEMAEPISRASEVIFVDVALAGRPGDVGCTAVPPAAPTNRVFSHHLTPATLLGLARTLYGRCPLAHLVTITGRDFGHQESLSDPVEDGIKTAVAAAKRLLRQNNTPVITNHH